MHAFVIHHEQCVERQDIVDALKYQTGAVVVDACWGRDRIKGCRDSHLKVAALAKRVTPDKPYLIFEDDCILRFPIDCILAEFPDADVVYLGYNDMSESVTYGTHALMISPKARDVILEQVDRYAEQHWANAYDHILSLLCQEFHLTVAKPLFDDRERYAVQKKGLVSTITGNERK